MGDLVPAQCCTAAHGASERVESQHANLQCDDAALHSITEANAKGLNFLPTL